MWTIQPKIPEIPKANSNETEGFRQLPKTFLHRKSREKLHVVKAKNILAQTQDGKKFELRKIVQPPTAPHQKKENGPSLKRDG